MGLLQEVVIRVIAVKQLAPATETILGKSVFKVDKGLCSILMIFYDLQINIDEV